MMLDRKRLRITRDNIDQAFPDADAGWKGAVVSGSYVNLGICLAELMILPSMSKEELLRRVRISGLDEVKSRLDQGLPTVLVSGHLGNWEWMAVAAGLILEHPLVIVTHPQRNAVLDALLNSYRTLHGNKLVSMHNAARSLVATMKEGGVVAFLADQHASAERDPWIAFFGRETPTYAAPAALALRMHAALYFGTAVRQDDGTYIVNVRQLPSDDLDDSPESIRQLTCRHVQALQDVVTEHPQLWSWQHRRWRSPKPPSTNAHDENRHATTTQ